MLVVVFEPVMDDMSHICRVANKINIVTIFLTVLFNFLIAK